MRIMLQNKKYEVLNFSNVLTDKLELIGQQFELPIGTVWAMCKLQRCTRYASHNLWILKDRV
jgi:hypothetical protein